MLVDILAIIFIFPSASRLEIASLEQKSGDLNASSSRWVDSLAGELDLSVHVHAHTHTGRSTNASVRMPAPNCCL